MLTVNFIAVAVRDCRIYKLTALALLVLTFSSGAQGQMTYSSCKDWNALPAIEGWEALPAAGRDGAIHKLAWIDGYLEAISVVHEFLEQGHKGSGEVLAFFFPSVLTVGETAHRLDNYCSKHPDSTVTNALQQIATETLGLADSTGKPVLPGDPEHSTSRPAPIFAITEEPPPQASAKSPRTDSYPETGKIIRTTTARSTFDVQNSETKQITSVDRDEPVMYLQTSTDIFEIHDVARRRFHPLPAGSAWHFRISGNAVCMLGVPGKKPKEEQCYQVEGREVRRN
jgi:hypothetical protein